MSDASTNHMGFVPQALFAFFEFMAWMGDVWATEVLQFDVFEMVPDAFVGVEFRCVGGRLRH